MKDQVGTREILGAVVTRHMVESILILEEAVETLEGKLTKVMRESVPTTVEGIREPLPQQDLPELLATWDNLAQKIDNLHDQVSSILHRLEI